MIYVIPDLALTVAITSAEDQPSARSGYVQELHRLVSETIVPAAEARRAAEVRAESRPRHPRDGCLPGFILEYVSRR